MKSDKKCKVLCGGNNLAVAQGVKPENVYTSPFVGLRQNGTIVEECFFHGNAWRYIVVNHDKKEVVELPEAYLGLSNAWYQNFFHFMTEMMPKLYLYAESGLECPILIPPTSKLVRDVLKVFGIPEDRLMEMQAGTEYQVGLLHYDGYSNLNSSALDEFQINAFKKLRAGVHVESDGAARNLYIARNDHKDIDNGCTKNGIKRVIVNEAEILSQKLPDYEVESVGNMSFAEKGELLKDVERVVTPFGGGVMNLIIAPRLKRVQILAPDKHKFLCRYMEMFLKEVMPELDVSVVWGKFVDDHDGIDANRNPYTIPTDKVTP